MKVILFGASGMVGQGVLRECLLDPGVEKVLAVGRAPLDLSDPKLVQRVLPDMMDLSSIEGDLQGLNACFYCVGVTSTGMTEADYARVTVDLTLAAARPLARLSPGLTFVFVSGTGTDSSEKGPVMWARVKGRTENALFALPFKAVCAFRPGFIRPLHGARSRTRSYRIFYTLARPLLPLLNLFPSLMTSTEQIGKAMLICARQGAPKRILETRDINAL